MSASPEHPLVVAYLRELDDAVADASARAAERAEQRRTRLRAVLPAGADDATVRAVLARLGPAAPGTSRARRAVAAVRRMRWRAWLTLAVLIVVIGVPAGSLIYWQAQDEVSWDGSFLWWNAQDAAHSVQTEADGASQDTIPLRPGQIQGLVIQVYNPSDVTQRIIGAPANSISIGAPVPAQIAIASIRSFRQDWNPRAVAYQAGGAIAPHSYAWLRVLWRSWQCYMEGPGGSQGTDHLTLLVKVGWVTRTENVSLGGEAAVSPTAKWAAWCNHHSPVP